MAVFTGKTFKGTIVNLDGNTFRDCVFDDCQIIYSGAEVDIAGVMTTNCSWELRDAALRTLNFIRDYNIPIR